MLSLFVIYKDGSEVVHDSIKTPNNFSFNKDSFNIADQAGLIVYDFLMSGEREEVFQYKDKKKIMQCLRRYDHIWGCNEIWEWLDYLEIEPSSDDEFYLQIRVNPLKHSDKVLNKIRDLGNIII